MLCNPIDKLVSGYSKQPSSKLATLTIRLPSIDGFGDRYEYILSDFPSVGVPWLMQGLGALYAKARVADRLPAIANVTISNVPGPTVPLFIAGARMLSNYPTSIVVHGVALNITVQTYDESLEFGLIACGRAMPEVAELARHVQTAFDEFEALPAAAAPAADPVPAPATAGKRIAVKKAPRPSNKSITTVPKATPRTRASAPVKRRPAR